MRDLAMRVLEGEIMQIDYDEQHRITVIHLKDREGYRDEIRFTYPELQLDITPDQNPVVFLRPTMRPEVAVVRFI